MCPKPTTRTLLGVMVVVGLVCSGFLQSCTSTSRPIDRFPGYPVGFVERGEASWYGPGFHGNKTANGEHYDMHKLTAAHRTLPLGSIAVVRSLTSGRHVTVRINDRGPFARGRILDLSLAGAQAIGMVDHGTDRVELQVVGYDARPEGMGFLRVQIGSFADLHNARALLDQVRSDFSEGRIIEVDVAEGRRYRVQVGKFLIESEARTLAARADWKLKIQSLVIRDDG